LHAGAAALTCQQRPQLGHQWVVTLHSSSPPAAAAGAAGVKARPRHDRGVKCRLNLLLRIC
jgi:hypothetical protein